MLKGIDLSYAQPSVNWPKIRKDGVRFAFLKVNEGDLIDKKTSRARVEAAKQAGILVGGYNFVRPRKGRTGAQEFDIFYERAKAVGLLDRGCLRPVIDIEATKLSPFRTRLYVKSWIRRCKKRLGVSPIIYTGAWFWDSPAMKGNKNTTRGCKLWLAAYVKDHRKYVPNGFTHASFWQNTDAAHIDGIPGPCDGNVYFSTLSDLKRYHTLPRSAPR